MSEHLAHDETYFGFLRLAAAAIDQAVDRIRAREAEDAVAEALQRSLLTEPPAVAGMSIAVRYRPAAERARVGGDWYDAFLGPDGQLNVVVGDVTGHDQTSAAAMGQLRNVLRGVAWTLGRVAGRRAARVGPRRGRAGRWGPTRPRCSRACVTARCSGRTRGIRRRC